MDFRTRLKQAWEKNNSLLCVGLDGELSKLPAHLADLPNPIFQFNKEIIDATHDLVCAFKPQIAFYAAARAEADLEMTIAYIRAKYPDLLVILDSKRGDIGNTASLYAQESFTRYQADAVTVNPYLGLDSLKPFIEHKNKGIFILVRTSNPGAKDLQDLRIGESTLYQTLAVKIAKEWNYNGNIAIVVGATYPKELKEIRGLVGDIPFLMPGIGAQGGDIEAAVTNGADSQGKGMIINSSRAIIYASSGQDFAQAARRVAAETNAQINRFRNVKV
jgi:orotidine-5'-phosphate decarboxylase